MASKATKVKLSRQLGIPLTPKAIRFMERKPHPPGEHGARRQRAAKVSDYKRQLMEKQRLRHQYNLDEKQLRTQIRKASRKQGDPTDNIIQALETRLDAMVFRAGLAKTIFAARQYVNHRHILLNGKWVSRPSHRVRVGDVVSVRPKSRKLPCFVSAAEEMVGPAPPYLERSREEMSAKLTHLPEREEVPVSCLIGHVIEYYSR